MPTIVFVSPKGGVGKTTAALLLSTQIAQEGAAVTLIDADPNRPLQSWQEDAGPVPGISVVSDVTEDNIQDRIDEAAARTPFVVVDLEGSAAKIVLLAIGGADLVLIPSQGSHLDAKQAARALAVIRQHERLARRSVPHAVVLTRTNVAVKSRSTKATAANLQSSGIPVLSTQLHEREAFRAMFAFGATLATLKDTEAGNLAQARENAQAFAHEVAAMLMERQEVQS